MQVAGVRSLRGSTQTPLLGGIVQGTARCAEQTGPMTFAARPSTEGIVQEIGQCLVGGCVIIGGQPLNLADPATHHRVVVASGDVAN